MKAKLRAWAVALRERLLSVPVAVKILGIGALVGLIFGLAIYLQVGRMLSTQLYSALEARARSAGKALVVQIEQSLIMDDPVGIEELLAKAKKQDPDILYAVLRDAEGRPWIHTFKGGLPEGLEAVSGDFRVLQAPEGRLIEVALPVLGGRAGSLQLALGDPSVRAGLRALEGSLFKALGLSATLGACLGYLLAMAIVGPVRALVRAAQQLGRGDFSARVPKLDRDEIGELAEAFNQMAERLKASREQLDDKERSLRALMAKLLRAQEDERAAVSRELHDHLGQSLSALLIRLQTSRGGPAAEEGLRASEGVVLELIEDVRRLAWGMRPSVLDDSGLDLAIRRLAEDLKRRGDISVDYQCHAADPGRRLPAPIELAFYRLAQEALTNVQRHSGAAGASLVLIVDAQAASLVVEDNGRGMAESGLMPKRRGMGIPGMRERIEMLGGTFSVESIEGRGTTVAARVSWS